MNKKIKIATIAAGLKKPKKADIFKTITKIIETDNATDQQLADLYAFFIPQVAKIKTPFHWLVKARGVNDVRYYLNHVYSDGTRTMATNGHVAHILNEPRPEGYYDDNEQLITVDGKFPDIDRVMPSGDGVVVNINDLKVDMDNMKWICYLMPDGNGMNKQYLDNACGLSPCYEITYFPDRNVCTVKHVNGVAIVMGTKL